MADAEAGAIKVVLAALEADGLIACTLDLPCVVSGAVPHAVIVGAVKALETDEYVTTKVVSRTTSSLSPAGVAVIDTGAPELHVLRAVRASPTPLTQAAAEAAVSKNAVGIALKRKLVSASKKDGAIVLSAAADLPESPPDPLRAALLALRDAGTLPGAEFDAVRRGLVEVVEATGFAVAKGPHFAPTHVRPTAVLTAEHLRTGAWRDIKFKPFNLAAGGAAVAVGALHPLLRMRQAVRESFVAMGFVEMDTARWVESSFWNFDALFVGQSHPSRDSQDTFFTSHPVLAPAGNAPAEYVQKIRDAHETGAGCGGSRGHEVPWSEEEARRLVLRTHTTACTTRTLHQMAREGRVEGRYFSVDRVFRNEAMDATHLCEFHQVEGVVIGRKVSLAHLIGLLTSFFARIGIASVRVRPAYNPYTEPSMEIVAWSPQRNKWIEVGNSGMFRPEVMRPLGFAPDVSAVAWGLSLERPAMLRYALDSIHHLFGPRVSLKFVHTAAAPRFL